MSITLRNRPSLEFEFPTEIRDAEGQLGVLNRLGLLVSLPILLDELAPQLAAALDGDPMTTVAQR
ncbi:MAG: hypothetical protein M3143_12855 [Actinomycetota bacterium]|nr:hypothetical protein [Actinomycetota bacterium]